MKPTIKLLLLAVKAAGYVSYQYDNGYDGYDGIVLLDQLGRERTMWSPLNDDGDAARLACKLKLTVQHVASGVLVRKTIPHRDEIRVWIRTDDTSDICAVVRLAIVMAAAQIGELVK